MSPMMIAGTYSRCR